MSGNFIYLSLSTLSNNIFAWGMLVEGRCCWKWCKTHQFHQFHQLAVATCTSPSNKTGRKVIYVVVTECRKGLNPVLVHLFSMISEKQRILEVKRGWKTLPGGKPRKPVLIIGLLLTEVLTSHRQSSHRGQRMWKKLMTVATREVRPRATEKRK